MVQITLPDGSLREFSGPVSVADVAASIGAGLAKAALGGKVDGQLVDTSYRIDKHASVAIVTAKDPDGLDLIRHSTAHLLAYAVKSLFPQAQVTIGPVIENGFYYDFSFERPFTPEDLQAIEKRMTELAQKDEPVIRRVLPRDEAEVQCVLQCCAQHGIPVVPRGAGTGGSRSLQTGGAAVYRASEEVLAKAKQIGRAHV